jgi:pyruvyltransferase
MKSSIAFYYSIYLLTIKQVEWGLRMRIKIKMQSLKYFNLCTVLILCCSCHLAYTEEGLPLYYWKGSKISNFGDHLSLILVERIVQTPVQPCHIRFPNSIKLLAIGSILSAAANGDIVWGSGVNGKNLALSYYHFTHLDVRAVRGPLTRQFLMEKFHIKVPEIYGDPALLFPYFFPEFEKAQFPSYHYLIIPHYSEEKLFPKELFGNHVVYPTEPWDVVIRKILNSQFVISSSLHGIIIAEAYGIPSRLLRVTKNEPLFKYQDYYLGTNRPHFQFATSVEEALRMGGESPFKCDLEALYQAFPFEFWPNSYFKFQLLEAL